MLGFFVVFFLTKGLPSSNKAVHTLCLSFFCFWISSYRHFFLVFFISSQAKLASSITHIWSISHFHRPCNYWGSVCHSLCTTCSLRSGTESDLLTTLAQQTEWNLAHGRWIVDEQFRLNRCRKLFSYFIYYQIDSTFILLYNITNVKHTDT